MAVALPAPFLHEGPNQHRVTGEFGLGQTAIDPANFRQVLGSYPTGVCAITAIGRDGMPFGMVIGSFTSVSLDPPLVGFLPDKGSSSWPLIEQAGHFCVNVLASDQQQVCRQLAAKGPDKFSGVDYALSAHGHPVIAGSLARIDCDIHAVIDAGDHWFVLGKVLSLEATRNDDPMLFHRGRYGGFAEIA
jgi:3-hydroxy-9,10-secoandrosta-1,3,5(10)-triene-9,17-dione monooxygenase reductase component